MPVDKQDDQQDQDQEQGQQAQQGGDQGQQRQPDQQQSQGPIPTDIDFLPVPGQIEERQSFQEWCMWTSPTFI